MYYKLNDLEHDMWNFLLESLLSKCQTLRKMDPSQKFMDEKKSENTKKTPEKMSRIAWPKAKYGFILAIIIFVVINLIYYKEKIISLFN